MDQLLYDAGMAGAATGSAGAARAAAIRAAAVRCNCQGSWRRTHNSFAQIGLLIRHDIISILADAAAGGAGAAMGAGHRRCERPDGGLSPQDQLLENAGMAEVAAGAARAAGVSCTCQGSCSRTY